MSRDVLGDHVAAWMQRAAADLAAAEHDLRAEPPLLADVVFHCQQSAEKALKALLTAQGVPFGKTHVIGELAAKLTERDSGFEPLLREAARLTVYAWRYRYPGDFVEPPHDEAVEALEVAQTLFDAVRERLARRR
ncbi:MAG: HEPN domain-containing protein [Actinobacteria bacterium]|nr:MAG: HEPN domain-containing protein [Actinomycetota bacterium]